jgi:hypothetical protein
MALTGSPSSILTRGFGAWGSTSLMLTRGLGVAEIVATGDPLDATFAQRGSRFHTRTTQRKLGTTSQGRLHYEENDTVEPE